ncbi:MAG TPA: hypothetical protein VFA82_06855 [Gaiellaceae bacterium]|nr:hypothetical protein [Gaiellaceae bacterium]
MSAVAPLRFFELLRTLSRHDADFILIGGFAVTLHGHVRTTKDVDIVPDPDEANMRRLWAALLELHARPIELDEFATDELPVPFAEQEFIAATGNWALHTTCGRLDVMCYVETVDGELSYAELHRRAERVDLEELRGTPLFVASFADLIAMKERAGRDVDRLDVTALRMAHGEDE